MENIILMGCGVIILVTLLVIVMNLRAQKRISWLVPFPPSEPKIPKISVVIPARNEEKDIVESLHSVLNQRNVHLEVIVVDDHSTDQTGLLVEAVAKNDPRVTVLHNPPLQDGWLGKVNAMEFGAKNATGEYLIFSDADIHHVAGCFESAYDVMKRNNYDFFSYFPRLLNETIWEHINMPIYLLGFIKFFSMSGLDNPDSSNAVASGAFMMIRGTVFKEIGGFERIKAEMFDDAGLARSLKADNYRVSYWFAPECSQVRLFKNASDAFWGTTKNILGAVDGHASLAIPLVIAGLVQYWTSLFAVAVGSMHANPLLIAAGVGTYVIQYLSFFSVRRLIRFYPYKLIWFPLAVIVGTVCIIRAVFYQMKGAIFWRGRAVKIK